MVQRVLLSSRTSVEPWRGVEMLPLVLMLEVVSLKITPLVELSIQNQSLASITTALYGQISFTN